MEQENRLNKRMFFSRRMMMFLALVGLVLLSACGKRPSNVDPPVGVDASHVRVYPNPDTDPKP